jgi:hypothetical protein
MDAEEWSAWARSEADAKTYQGFLFSLGQLQEIAAKAKAPAFQDTSAVQEIISRVSELALDSQINTLKKSRVNSGDDWKIWCDAQRIVDEVLSHELKRQELWRALAIMRGKTYARPDNNEIRRLKALLTAMNEAEPMLKLREPRGRGKRGATQFRNPKLVPILFELLFAAWREAGAKAASNEKAYAIIRDLAVVTGDDRATSAGVKQLLQKR